MARFGGMVCVTAAIVLLVALCASPAESAGRSLGDTGANAMAAASSDVSRPSDAGDLVFCIKRNCVYAGRGNADCFCCAAMKPNTCYETRAKCSANCA
ncbi:hypothetical protein BAE44_0019842 [Dichanthelium oligosanthes]|uniref:Embryo surrounding factor 1 brassicaceae domain-containing protein n=1 Tax=Dichanthelium oligosanthes TaxID=888268 RepID=A0A1E5V1Z8_9POAL|nr:hypothetical protein BAE44_0019842 [Dichanthelium oligosanthes]